MLLLTRMAGRHRRFGSRGEVEASRIEGSHMVWRFQADMKCEIERMPDRKQSTYKLKNYIFPMILHVFSICVTLAGFSIIVLGFMLATRGGSTFYLASGSILLTS